MPPFFQDAGQGVNKCVDIVSLYPEYCTCMHAVGHPCNIAVFIIACQSSAAHIDNNTPRAHTHAAACVPPITRYVLMKIPFHTTQYVPR